MHGEGGRFAQHLRLRPAIALRRTGLFEKIQALIEKLQAGGGIEDRSMQAPAGPGRCQTVSAPPCLESPKPIPGHLFGQGEIRRGLPVLRQALPPGLESGQSLVDLSTVELEVPDAALILRGFVWLRIRQLAKLGQRRRCVAGFRQGGRQGIPDHNGVRVPRKSLAQGLHRAPGVIVPPLPARQPQPGGLAASRLRLRTEAGQHSPHRDSLIRKQAFRLVVLALHGGMQATFQIFARKVRGRGGAGFFQDLAHGGGFVLRGQKIRQMERVFRP